MSKLFTAMLVALFAAGTMTPVIAQDKKDAPKAEAKKDEAKKDAKKEDKKDAKKEEKK